MNSKLNSIVITSILAFVLIAAAGLSTPFENVLGQEGAITPEGSVNDTMSGQNASQWTNATLAFAQEDDTGMTSEGGDMGDMNQSQGNETGMVQGQSNEAKNDGNNEEEEGDDE
jgi:hypothetical protein